MAAWYAVCFTILDELCPRLVEMKGNIRLDALVPNGENPRIVAWACMLPRFASYTHFLDASVKIGREINGSNQWCNDNTLVFDGQRFEDRQSVIGHLLVLYRAAYQHIVITVSPIIGHALHETVDTLGEEIEPEVAPPLNHQPALLTPLVSISEQEVGSETGEYHLAALNLP